MAKLNGVRTVDMENGEITKVLYDGAEYAKVCGLPSETVEVGDIATVKDDLTEFFSANSYYVAARRSDYGDMTFKDNFGGFTSFSDMNERVTLFRKISASTAQTLEAVAEKVDAIDKRVSALEGADKAEDPLKAGDYIEIDTSEYDVDITEGKAYEVKDGDSGLYFVDDVGDERLSPIDDGAYTKVDAPKPAFKTEKRHAKVGERILITRAMSSGGTYANGDILTVRKDEGMRGSSDAIQAEGIPVGIFDIEYEVIVEGTEKPAQSIEHNGASYTLVSRKAQPGDVVVLTESGGYFSKTGKSYEVLDGVKIGVRHYTFDLYKDNLGRTEATVLVYAPAEELKVGEYAVVISSEDKGYGFGGEVGDIVEIVGVDSSDEDLPYKTRKIGGGNFVGPWAPASFLRKATDAEVAAVTALSKPKTGDIVVITANTNASRNAVGDIGKVGETLPSQAKVDVPGKTRGNGNYTRYTEMRLATPAEIERYEGAVKAHNAPKFAEGDYAKALADSENGDLGEGVIVKIGSTDCGIHGDPYSIYVETLDGSDYDYFRPQDLEKLEGKALVFAKAGRKVNEYKAGDVVMTHDGTNGHNDVIGVVDGNQITNRPAVIARYTDGRKVGLYSHCTPIAFVESRVDRA